MRSLQIITECYDHKLGGLARYEKVLIDELKERKKLGEEIFSNIIPIAEVKKQSRLKQLQFFLFEEIYNKAKPKTTALTHLLNQQLALSLNFVPLSNVVVTVHDLAFLIPQYYKKLTFLEKLRYQLVKKGLQRADWIITDATFTKQEIIKYLKFPRERIFVVPLGVNHEVFHKLHLQEQERQKYRHFSPGPVILYVGSEIPRMNLPVLLKAFALVHKEFPTTILLKVGEAKSAEGRRETLQILKALKIQDAVIFKEQVSEEDLVKYYNSADIFVYPISYTGYGLPILEALSCGCPVITTTSSTLPEVVGNAGLLFNPDNVEQLTEHISMLLKSKRLREDLQKKGFIHSKNLSWNACISKTIAVYDAIQEETSCK